MDTLVKPSEDKPSVRDGNSTIEREVSVAPSPNRLESFTWVLAEQDVDGLESRKLGSVYVYVYRLAS